MGPYCKFCGTRCFVPTTKDDIVKTDLKATCEEGIKFDLQMTEKENKARKSIENAIEQDGPYSHNMISLTLISLKNNKLANQLVEEYDLEELYGIQKVIK
jgi:hypothetical protein